MAAYQAASGRGHDEMGTRHLMLGLLYDEGCAAHRVLAPLGVTYKAADERVGFFTMEMCPSYPRVDSGTERALVDALREARRLGHDVAGTGHLLLGVLSDTHGSGPHLLRMLGVDPALAGRDPLFAEDPAPVPYPLPVFKSPDGQRDLAFVDRLLSWCRKGLDEENGS
jgi:ATP-dependent Clp protease ATP-binding subunit ClpA